MPAVALPPLSPAHHRIDLPAAAVRTDEPGAPIEHGRFGAVPSSHLGGIGLDLMLAILAPHDQPDLCRGSASERHRRGVFGFHLTTGI
jgi:hypothetical protein